MRGILCGSAVPSDGWTPAVRDEMRLQQDMQERGRRLRAAKALRERETMTNESTTHEAPFTGASFHFGEV